MKKVLPASLILLLAIPHAFSATQDELMELEIKRHLENIQKTGEIKWSLFIHQNKKKNEEQKKSDLKVRMVVN